MIPPDLSVMAGECFSAEYATEVRVTLESRLREDFPSVRVGETCFGGTHRFGAWFAGQDQSSADDQAALEQIALLRQSDLRRAEAQGGAAIAYAIDGAFVATEFSRALATAPTSFSATFQQSFGLGPQRVRVAGEVGSPSLMFEAAGPAVVATFPGTIRVVGLPPFAFFVEVRISFTLTRDRISAALAVSVDGSVTIAGVSISLGDVLGALGVTAAVEMAAQPALDQLKNQLALIPARINLGPISRPLPPARPTGPELEFRQEFFRVAVTPEGVATADASMGGRVETAALYRIEPLAFPTARVVVRRLPQSGPPVRTGLTRVYAGSDALFGLWLETRGLDSLDGEPSWLVTDGTITATDGQGADVSFPTDASQIGITQQRRVQASVADTWGVTVSGESSVVYDVIRPPPPFDDG